MLDPLEMKIAIEIPQPLPIKADIETFTLE